jgi:hypothetical protein
MIKPIKTTPDLDGLASNLEQAEGILNAVVDQAYLNGPDAVKPAALIAAHNAVAEAAQKVKAITLASTGPAMDSDRYRRAVSMLEVLLEKTEADDSGIQVCDTLENAITELKAAGGMEQ